LKSTAKHVNQAISISILENIPNVYKNALQHISSMSPLSLVSMLRRLLRGGHDEKFLLTSMQ
jgi:hypothetical protein